MASTRWCKVCGGQGWVDEAAARRWNFSLQGQRTDVCPACHGSGAPGYGWELPGWAIPAGLAALALVALAGLALFVWS